MLNAMKNQRANLNTPQIADTPRSQIARRLQDAIHELHADVARVELWASALMSFTQPIPEYNPSKWNEINRTDAIGPKGPPAPQ